MMQEDRRSKVKKGWLVVRVGQEEAAEEGGGFQRFTIPISYLYHPQFERLLEAAREIYGYHSSGPLKLPSSVDDFLQLRWLIERESAAPPRQPQPSASSSAQASIPLHALICTPRSAREMIP